MERGGQRFAIPAQATFALMDNFDYTAGLLAAIVVQLLFVAVAVLTHREEEDVDTKLNEPEKE